MLTLEKGARLCGRFTLIERIGTGGQGEIWRATDDTAGAEIALKVLHPEVARSADAWESLRHEYTVAQRLGHSGIVEIGEPVRDDLSTVLPMTLATGDLRRFRGEPYTRIVPALLEVAAALEHAHSRGVVHRDIKPSNVLIDQDGHINIADFGAAALDGAVFGRGAHSPFSASPQQLEGEPPALADDVYGLGALAYELLSGYPPYYPDFEPRAVLGEPVPALTPIHTAPPRLLRLIMRMLAKDPADRPATMRDVQEELHAALHDTVAETPPLDFATAVDLADDMGNSHISSTRLREAARAALAPPAVDLADADGTADAVEPPVLSPAFADPIAARLDALPEERVNLTVAEARQDLLIETSDDTVIAEVDLARGSRAGSLLKWGGLALLAAALVGVFVYLPRVAEQRAAVTAPLSATPAAANAKSAPVADPAQLFAAQHAKFTAQLVALEARGAAIWGGPGFAGAKALGADAVAALNAGANEVALDRVKIATQRLERVAAEAATAAKTQLAAGERALADGELLVAQQAFELAQRIEPDNAAARDGLARAGRLTGVLPQLAEADNALAAGAAPRAIELYGKVLEADPRNAAAQAGLERARAGAGDDAFARQMGETLGALRAGQFDAARAALERARGLRPAAPEVAAAQAELASAQAGRGLAAIRERAAGLETQERWAEALAEYDTLLRTDPGVEFATAGRTRAAPRAELAAGLQGLIDKPERLAAAEVRAEADALLARARSVTAGPVLRSQVVRVEALLPAWDIPVRLVIESDGQTNVVVQRVGALGSFERQEVELKPGRYTMVGTRTGYRDVRRDVTVAPVVPGQQPPTVAVRCVDPVR